MNHFTGPAVGKAELTIRGKKRCLEPFPINIGFDHNRRTKQLQLTGAAMLFLQGLSSNQAAPATELSVRLAEMRWPGNLQCLSASSFSRV